MPFLVITDTEPGGFSEYAMLKIRLMEGVNVDFCKEVYGIDKEKILIKSRLLEKNNLIKVDGSRIFLTPEGCLLSNQIIGHLFL